MRSQASAKRTRESSPIKDAALRDLIEQGVLSVDQASAVQDALRRENAKPALLGLRVRWSEVAGYLGGGLLLTGAVLLAASTWDRLSEAARIGFVGTFAGLLLVAGVIAAGGPAGLRGARRLAQMPRMRVASALLALGAGATAVAVDVALPDDFSVWGGALAVGIGFVVAVTGYAFLPVAFGLIASTVLGVATVMSSVEAAFEMTPLVAGLSLSSAGLALAAMAFTRAVHNWWLGVGMGLAIAIIGAQQPLGQEGTEAVGYVLTFAIGIGCLVLWHWVREWLLAGFGVIGVAISVPEAIWHLTDGAVGAAVVPLIAGAILLIASGIGLRKHRAV